jgi:hypothetical protein
MRAVHFLLVASVFSGVFLAIAVASAVATSTAHDMLGAKRDSVFAVLN